MFGFKKRLQNAVRELEIKKLEAEIAELKSQAIHFYKARQEVESRAFYDLAELARNKKLSAQQAAKTEEGIRILAEVVLNRQWFFYHNESAIQAYAKLKTLLEPDWFRLSDQNQWFDEVVSIAGKEIVVNQIDDTCGKLITEVDDYIK